MTRLDRCFSCGEANHTQVATVDGFASAERADKVGAPFAIPISIFAGGGSGYGGLTSRMTEKPTSSGVTSAL